MTLLPLGVKVHLALGFIDMRKGIDGLAMLVQGVLRQDPFTGHLFVFRGRKANLIKIVFWDGTGLCLFTKRLEHGVFLWLSNVDPGGTLALSSAQLSMLIDGIDWRAPERQTAGARGSTMAGFATPTSFVGHPSRSATAGHALTFNPDHLMGAGHESFNSKLRDELLNGEIFYTLEEARVIIERWRRHYNTVRPHSSLGYKPPAPEALQWPASQPRPASSATPAVAPRLVMH